MKMLVVYESGTGFTKQYAEWIASEMGCEAKPIKQVSVQEVGNCERIVFGGWIFGGMIMGLNKIRKMSPKQLVIFAVGASKPGVETENKIKEANQLENQPFFYFEGGFHYDKLGFFKKKMLGMVKKSIAKKTDKTEDDKFMERVLGTSFDHADKIYIKEMTQFLNK